MMQGEERPWHFGKNGETRGYHRVLYGADPEVGRSVTGSDRLLKCRPRHPCAKHSIQPSMFYHWQKDLFENNAPAFAPGRLGSAERKLNHQVEILSEKLERDDEVNAEC